ncbi:hypothetical protein E4U36_006438 [Claviceps purpurea]|nr:hypothetical protein E4U36_006438 [Claviceps purpurea]
MLFVLFFMIEQQGESQRGSRNAQVSYEKALGGNTPHSSIRGGRIDVDAVGIRLQSDDIRQMGAMRCFCFAPL